MNQKFWKRFWIIVWIVYAVLEIGCRALQPLLQNHGLEYRQYVTFLLLELLWMVPLFFGLFWIVFANYRGMMRKQRTGWTGPGIVAFVLYLLVLIAAQIVILAANAWNGDKETVQDHVIVVNQYNGIARKGTETYYCDPVGPFLRKPFTWDGEREKALLESHYDMKFMLVESEIGERSYIPEDYPDIQVHITTQIPLQDDMTDQLTADIFEKTYREQGMQTKSSLGIRGESESMFVNGNGFYLIADSEEALKSCAQDAAVLIEQACKEDYFKDHRGYLMCRLQYDDAEYDYVRLPFGTDTETYGTSLIGRLFGWSTAIDGESLDTPDYYATFVNVWPKLSTTWEALKDRVVYAYGVDGADIDGTGQGNSGNADSDIFSDSGNETDQQMQNIEEAAKLLYKDRKGTEEGFVLSYNAKGMPYVILEETNTVQDGQNAVKRQMLNYDRMSKNEECYLFSYEEEITDSEGNALSDSRMLDYYAVNVQSQTVTASGKHSYSDSGNAAYQEAAGEP